MGNPLDNILLPAAMVSPSPLTLAHYWERFNADDKAFLLFMLQRRRNNLHMGLLPFVPADEAAIVAFTYLIPTEYSTPHGYLIMQNVTQILRPHIKYERAAINYGVPQR